MNNLMKVITNDKGNKVTVIDSREVAEMLGKEHYEIIQYLEGRKVKGITKIVGIIPTLLTEHVQLDKYFILSSYKDSSGKRNKCYLCTKMGCELLGNKQQGEKGILFTAKYVERFNQYEEQLKGKSNTGSIDYDNAKAQMELLAVTANTLNLNDSSKLLIATKIYEDCNIPTTYLPDYTDSRGILKSATELLKENNISISTIKFNKIMIDKGYLIEVERTSGKDKSKIKKFKNLAKTEFGENQISPKNPKETQPMYYENKFLELLKELGIN